MFPHLLPVWSITPLTHHRVSQPCLLYFCQFIFLKVCFFSLRYHPISFRFLSILTTGTYLQNKRTRPCLVISILREAISSVLSEDNELLWWFAQLAFVLSTTLQIHCTGKTPGASHRYVGPQSLNKWSEWAHTKFSRTWNRVFWIKCI